MRKGWNIFVACLVVAVGMIVGLRACDEPAAPPPLKPDAGPGARQDASVDAGTVADAAPLAWIVPEPNEGSFGAQLDGASVEVEFLIGAAGVYPPLQTTGTHIALPEPAKTMGGETLETVEVYARTDDGAHAFWDEVMVEATTIDLTAAQSATVHIVGEDGAPRGGVTVRLARDVVGLVLLSATTDDEGRATFDALPAGEYTVVAESGGDIIAPGAVSAGAEVTLYATSTRQVFGTVTDPDGTPVPGAVVAVHGAGIDANPIDDIPADIVKTDARGEYRAPRVAGAQFVAVAIADGFPPAQASAVGGDGPTRLDLRMRRGQRVVALVTNKGEPFAGARVEWRDKATSTGMTRLSDDAGRVTFVGVPASAEVFAKFNHFESGRVELSTLDPAPHYDVTLALQSTDGRIWRYRVETPDRVTMSDLTLHDGRGVRCSLSTEDGRDFVARACGDGETQFEARTNFGIARWSAGQFVDGQNVMLPDPTPVSIRVAGGTSEPWASTLYTLGGPGAVARSPDVTELAGNGQLLSSRVYPGRWKLIVSNPRIGTLPFTLQVEEEPLQTEIELVALHKFSLTVVDRFGAPITGAYAMLFNDAGKLIDVSRSAGQLPVEFRVRPPFNGALLVVDPRRGEGHVELQSSGDAPGRVELDKPVLSTAVPTSRPNLAEFQQRTGAKLVERDAGWVLDFEAETAGTRAGLQRGDLLVTAWAVGNRLRVIVKRGARYVDVTLS